MINRTKFANSLGYNKNNSPGTKRNCDKVKRFSLFDRNCNRKLTKQKKKFDTEREETFRTPNTN